MSSINERPMSPAERLRYHVTGAIERGEKQPIVEVPVSHSETAEGERCPFRWTPEHPSGYVYPEVQCTELAGTEHDHRWSSDEHDLWMARELRVIRPQ